MQQKLDGNKQENFEQQSQTQEVKISDLDAWRQEAQSLNRSDNHLAKIDRVIDSSTTANEINQSDATVKIDERDFKAMQRDRSEFKQQEQKQEHSQNQSIARGKGRGK